VAKNMEGVGKILSVGLIAEIGDVRCFHNCSVPVAFAGIRLKVILIF